MTRDEMIAIIGPADDLILAEIAGTGVTAAELAEAKTWLASDEGMMNEGRPIPSGRIGRVIEILRARDEERENLSISRA